MKVLSITEPFASLISSILNILKHVLGKHLIAENYIFMPLKLRFLKYGEKIKN